LALAQAAPETPSRARRSTSPGVATRVPAAPVVAPGLVTGQAPPGGNLRRHRPDEPQPDLHVRELRRGQGQSACPRRGNGRWPSTPPRTTRLFVYGGVGLGKTHLIQAIGNDILHARTRREDPLQSTPRTLCVGRRGAAYQHRAFDDFKRYYRSLDLLLIDDIQFFGGKSRTQEEFFYLFNTLVRGAQAGGHHLRSVIRRRFSGIEERLISRFGWGLTVALEPPELEMRVAILLAKAQTSRLKLDEQVAFFIAKHIRSNVRELEGALKSGSSPTRPFHGRRSTLPVAKEALRILPLSRTARSRSRTSPEDGRRLLQDPQSRTCTRRSASRARGANRGRWPWRLAKELTQLSLPEIGKQLSGGRDHTRYCMRAVRSRSCARPSRT